MIDLKTLVDEVGLVAFAKTEAGKRIMSPLADEIGNALGTCGEIVRYYQNEALATIFSKWSASRGMTRISEDDLRRVTPLLLLASVQSDEDLQTRWAALLESTVSDSENTLPSFGATLSQINADEAKFLDRLSEAAYRTFAGAQFHIRGPGQMSYAELVKIYDPSISCEIDPLTMGFMGDSEPDLNAMRRAQLVIDDLVRIGIVTTRDSALTANAEQDFMLETAIMSWYSLSPYGVAFIRAVTPAKTG